MWGSTFADLAKKVEEQAGAFSTAQMFNLDSMQEGDSENKQQAAKSPVSVPPIQPVQPPAYERKSNINNSTTKMNGSTIQRGTLAQQTKPRVTKLAEKSDAKEFFFSDHDWDNKESTSITTAKTPQETTSMGQPQKQPVRTNPVKLATPPNKVLKTPVKKPIKRSGTKPAPKDLVSEKPLVGTETNNEIAKNSPKQPIPIADVTKAPPSSATAALSLLEQVQEEMMKDETKPKEQVENSRYGREEKEKIESKTPLKSNKHVRDENQVNLMETDGQGVVVESDGDDMAAAEAARSPSCSSTGSLLSPDISRTVVKISETCAEMDHVLEQYGADTPCSDNGSITMELDNLASSERALTQELLQEDKAERESRCKGDDKHRTGPQISSQELLQEDLTDGDTRTQDDSVHRTEPLTSSQEALEGDNTDKDTQTQTQDDNENRTDSLTSLQEMVQEENGDKDSLTYDDNETRTETLASSKLLQEDTRKQTVDDNETPMEPLTSSQELVPEGVADGVAPTQTQDVNENPTASQELVQEESVVKDAPDQDENKNRLEPLTSSKEKLPGHNTDKDTRDQEDDENRTDSLTSSQDDQVEKVRPDEMAVLDGETKDDAGEMDITLADDIVNRGDHHHQDNCGIVQLQAEPPTEKADSLDRKEHHRNFVTKKLEEALSGENDDDDVMLNDADDERKTVRTAISTESPVSKAEKAETANEVVNEVSNDQTNADEQRSTASTNPTESAGPETEKEKTVSSSTERENVITADGTEDMVINDVVKQIRVVENPAESEKAELSENGHRTVGDVANAAESLSDNVMSMFSSQLQNLSPFATDNTTQSASALDVVTSSISPDVAERFMAQIKRLEDHHASELKELEQRHQVELKAASNHDGCLKKMRELEKDFRAELSEREESIAEILQKNEGMTLKIDLLRRELDGTKALLDKREIDIGEVNDSRSRDVQKVEKQLKDAEVAASASAKEIKRLSDELEASKAEVVAASESYSKLKTRVKEVATELKERRVECRGLHSSIKELTTSNENLQTQVEGLKSQLSRQNQSRIESEQAIGQLRSEKNRLEEEVAASEKKIREHDEMGEKALASYKKKAQSALAAANARIATANQEKEEAEREALAVKSSVQESLDRAKVSEQNAHAMFAKAENLTASFESQKQEILKEAEDAQSALLDTRKELDSARKELEDSLSERRRLEEAGEEAIRALQTERSKSIALEQQISDMRGKEKNFRAEVESLRQELRLRQADSGGTTSAQKDDDGMSTTNTDDASEEKVIGDVSEAEAVIFMLQQELDEANDAIFSLKEALKGSLDQSESQLRLTNESGVTDNAVSLGGSSSTYHSQGSTESTPLFFAMEKQAELNTARDEITRLANLLGDAETAKMEAYDAMQDMRRQMEEAQARLRRQEKLGGTGAPRSKDGGVGSHHPESQSYSKAPLPDNSQLVASNGQASNGIVGGGPWITENGAATDAIVNIEYLKNVMLSYLNAKSLAERKALVPVLAAVLELTPEEQAKALQTVEESGELQGVGSAFLESLGSKVHQLM